MRILRYSCKIQVIKKDKISMCKFKELISLADEMAAGAASLALGPQNYQQFVQARERVVKRVEELKESIANKD